ncbi:MAG: glycosyltransferase family 4 protein [Actinomycetota bacterium]
MRILTLAEFYPPVIGGLEKHAQRLTHELRRRGHDVAVATLAVPGEPEHSDDEGIPVTRIDGWRKALDRFYEDGGRGFHPTAPDPGLQKRLAEIVREFDPDVVHVHGWILYSALTRRRSDEHAVVATMHDFGLPCPKRNYLHMETALCSGPGPVKCYRCAIPHYGLVKGVGLTTGLKISTRLHARADRFVAVSSAVRNAVVDAGANQDVPVEVVPNFFDPSGATDAIGAPRPDCVPAEGDYVLFVGALNEFKGVHLLNEIWRTRRPAAPLVLLGNPRADTPDPSSLPEGVTMVQNVPHPDVMAAFANCTIAVSPSLGPDACPTTALEAMALGKPVVGTDIGGIPDLVLDSRTGIVVPPRDGQALGDAIDHLLAAPAVADQYGAAGRDHSTGFTVEAVAQRLEGTYARAIARRRHNGEEPPAPRTRADTESLSPSALPPTGSNTYTL